jgi:hypothetical protein
VIRFAARFAWRALHVVYTLAAYSITIGVLALYGVVLQHRSRVAAAVLSRAKQAPVMGSVRGFNLGALLLAPFWMLAHGMRGAGALVLLAYVVLWPAYQQVSWIAALFVGAIPLAAGAALGFVGNRIAAASLELEEPDALSASQLPWALGGIVLYVFVLPWAAYFLGLLPQTVASTS